MTMMILIIALALIFDYINGFHDAANSIATVVSTKVLTPLQAVIWAAVFNMVAFWIFDLAVANTISKTVTKDFVTLPVILSGLIAAIFWNLLTWWYGIPSSSSHTLIGGFAGAALAHAMFTKGINISWGKVIESSIIIKTVLFIFLAPLIGIIVSLFITIVTIMRNIWLRILLITLATIIAFLLFDKFENMKMDENLEKFLKVDKYKKEVSVAQTKLNTNTNDSVALKEYNTAKTKLDKALPNYEKIKLMLANYDNLGAARIAKEAKAQGLLEEIAPSRLKDDVRNLNDYLVLESGAANGDTSKIKEYKVAKEVTEKYKDPLKAYLQKHISLDSTMAALNHIYLIEKQHVQKVRKKVESFTIEKALQKDIHKADNTALAWGLVASSIFFCLVYLYVEKIKTPTAYKIANMFKTLQLYSSAIFSIGHGGNDAQKVMGIIGVALIANGNIQNFSDLPTWVPIACYVAIGLGTMSGGWKIVKTMGSKITKVTPLEGVAAESAGAFTLFLTGQMGIPVSTTHTITGAIIGVGATKRLSAVRWGVTVNLLWAWILTIPVSGLLAAGVYHVVRLLMH
jgi:inorganic phosphate transporter, PiT family